MSPLRGHVLYFVAAELPFTAWQTAEAIIATKIMLASIPHAPVWWPLGARPAGPVLLTTHPGSIGCSGGLTGFGLIE